MDEVDALAEWSPWVPFNEALAAVPRLPGVYMFRLSGTGEVVYAGMAGARSGSGVPQGLRGRLTVYLRGRGAVSGFGEAALDRALADPDWVSRQLDLLRASGPKRAKVWAQEAIEYVAPDVRWAVCGDAAEARALEARVVELLAPLGLWNRPSRVRAPKGDAEAVRALGEVLEVRGYRIDLAVLYEEMYRHSVRDLDGSRVFAGNAPGVPAMKRLLHSLFGVPVSDRMHPVNNAARSAVRDGLNELGWATKDPGRSGRYVLHRDLQDLAPRPPS